MEPVLRTAEGHQVSLRLVRLQSNGNPLTDLEQHPPAGSGSPSMPMDAPFGLVHLGETFTSMLIITNESITRLDEPHLKIELQTVTQRMLLTETPQGYHRGVDIRQSSSQPSPLTSTTTPSLLAPLEPGEQLRIRTLHDIREVGVHILICSMHWLNPVTTERKFLRKFFRFAAVNPLTLKTKVTERPEYLLLEAQIQNVSTTGFILERVAMAPLDPNPQEDNYSFNQPTCHTIDVLRSPTDSLGVPDFEKLSLETASACYGDDREKNILAPDEMFQYVFVFALPFPINRKVPLSLGQLDISWRSEGQGEKGRLQTGTLLHHWEESKGGPGIVRAICKGVPSTISRGGSFDMLVIVQNYTQEKGIYDVVVGWEPPQLNEFPGLAPQGPIRVRLGEVTALNSARAKIKVVATGRPGLQQGEKSFYVQYTLEGITNRLFLSFATLITESLVIKSEDNHDSDKSCIRTVSSSPNQEQG